MGDRAEDSAQGIKVTELPSDRPVARLATIAIHKDAGSDTGIRGGAVVHMSRTSSRVRP